MAGHALLASLLQALLLSACLVSISAVVCRPILPPTPNNCFIGGTWWDYYALIPDVCFGYVPKLKTLNEAQHECRTLKEEAALLTIENQDANDQIQPCITPHPAWLGLVKRNDVWTWLDGRRPTYFNWGLNEPKNDTAYQCAAINGEDGSWVTMRCAEDALFTVCQVSAFN